MDEKQFEQAQALTERLTQAGIEQAMQCHLEPPMEMSGRRFCLDCCDEIAMARLSANPRAVRCVDCQNDHDRRHR
mgnify:CR=1 FL=1